MRQGAVGHIRLVERAGQTLVEKRMTDAARHDTELLALTAVADVDLPTPTIVEASAGSILMTRVPGERLDSLNGDERLAGLSASGSLLRRLHTMVPPPDGLPTAPDDALIVRRYRDAGGPRLPFMTPPAEHPVFCHGDWTDANLLATGGVITGIVDWERAHVGDPMRELSRAAWAASRKDPRSVDRLVTAYGADPQRVKEWFPIHAAELWLWFSEAGPPEFLTELTAQLENWSHM
ncbi:aminoglycoside phosphotransferase family protein [Microbacterium sp. CFH 90308]|uniref:Aminoglycoside phosphotransferase family protein n=1 Tax=Microbacterium salsuginis TaxID=2722803 RepID=A0ABX1KF60_9MICO|nr:phosphotransferase [Microbacterium sp. CFH 90308]NLP84021.1 aminoglycoside phosphotransferase family protein [Microbacterium sp. CFH 90308]